MNDLQQEIFEFLEPKLQETLDKSLLPIETSWQPGDLLPATHQDDFFDHLKLIQKQSKELPYDVLAVLIGDTITEEALPTYEAWLYGIKNTPENEESAWRKWVRGWTAEENRHGDILNRYLYLSGRVNMSAFERSTQFLIADGFDIQTDNCPYKSFVYTSFQELATNISHRRVATLAKKYGNDLLAKMCGKIASDEMRHANAYKGFVSDIFEIDPSGMMKAFSTMMQRKISMPAHLLKETGENISNVFAHFTNAAQRIGVYTTSDYINILEKLIEEWKIESRLELSAEAEKAREYIMRLPDRLKAISDRTYSIVIA
jgi:acyl-[acyl-carrier-protein] desaturase